MATFARRESAEIEETTTESHETTDQNRPEVIMPIPIRPIRTTPIAVRPRPPTPNSESPKNKMRKTGRSSDGVVSSEMELDETYDQANSNKKNTRQAQESKDETERMNNSTDSSVNSTNSAANKASLENLTTVANGELQSVDGNSSDNTATNVRMTDTPEITTKYNVVKIAPKIAPKIEDNRQSVIDFDKMVDDRSKQKLYPCPKCSRPFSRKFNMESHLTTHDPHRVKPFLCDYLGCGHRFTRKHDLKRHVNGIHKCEKQHRCPHCEKTFARKDAWKRHSFTCTINTEMPRVGEKKIDSDAVRIGLLANADATSVVVTENYVNK